MIKKTIKVFQEEIENTIISDKELNLKENLFNFEIESCDSFLNSLKDGEIFKILEKKENSKKKRKDEHNILYCQLKNQEDILTASLEKFFSLQNKNLDEKGIYSLYLCLSSLTYKKEGTLCSIPTIVIPVVIYKEKNDFYLKLEFEGKAFEHPLWRLKKEEFDSLYLPPFDETTIDNYLVSIETFLNNDLSLKYSNDIVLDIFDFSLCYINDKLKEDKETYSSNKFVKKYFLDLPKKEDSNRVPIFGLQQLHPIFNNDERMQTACLKAKNNENFAIMAPVYSKDNILLLNLISEAISDHKKILIVSNKNIDLINIYKNLETLKLDSYAIPLLSYKQDDERIPVLKNITSLKAPSNSNIEVSNDYKDKVDEYSLALYSPLETYSFTPYEVYLKLYSLKSTPDIEVKDFDIDDFDDRKYQFSLNNLTFIQDEIKKFGKKYTNYHFYGFKVSGEENLEEFEKILKECGDNFIVIKKLMMLLNPNKNLKEYHINDIRNLVLFLKNFYKLSIIDPVFFIKEQREELLEIFQEALPLVAIEETLKKSIKRIADDSILKIKNIHQLKDRIESKKKKFLFFFSKSFRKDLQTINEYALTPLNRTEAVELIHLVENYQVTHKKVLAYLNKVKKYLSPTSYIDETNFGKFVEENLFYQNINIDLSFLKGKSIESLYSLQKEIPIREINSLTYPETAQDYFDKKIKNFDKMNVFEIDNLIKYCQCEISNLESYMDLISRLEQAKKGHYYSFIEEFLNENIPLDSFVDCFKKVYFKNLLEYCFKKYPSLNSYTNKEYSRLINNYEKECNANLVNNLNYVRRNAYTYKSTNYKEIQPSSIKAISKVKDENQTLSIFKKYEDTISKLKLIYLSTINNVPYIFDETENFDLLIILKGSTINPISTIPSLIKAKQVIVFGDENYYKDKDTIKTDSLYSIISKYDEVKLNHTYLDSKLFSFCNKTYYNSNIFNYPSIHKDIITYRIVNVTKENNEQALDKEVELELERIIKNYPDESFGIITSDSKQKERLQHSLNDLLSNLENEEKPYVATVDEEVLLRDNIILALPFIFQTKDSIFETKQGRNYVNMMLTRAKKHLVILNYKKIDDYNRNIYSYGLRDLNEFFYNINNKNEKSVFFSNVIKEDIYQFLLERHFDVIKDYSCLYPIDFVICQNKKPVIAIDIDNLKGESKKCTYERELLRKNTLRNNGFEYIKISSPYFYNKEKEAKLELLTKITQILSSK